MASTRVAVGRSDSAYLFGDAGRGIGIRAREMQAAIHSRSQRPETVDTKHIHTRTHVSAPVHDVQVRGDGWLSEAAGGRGGQLQSLSVRRG
jgi:hypothetical protein